MDSGASDTMFITREEFTEYRPITPRIRDLAKAENGAFEIVREGNMVQWYEVDGNEQEVTYTHALHMLTLNANLVSISALDKASLIMVF